MKDELVTKEEFKEEMYKLRMDMMKMFYLTIIVLIILNGDKIINFLKFLIK